MVDYVPKMTLVRLLWVWVCVCIHVYVCADTVHTGACVWEAEEDLKCYLREPLTLFLRVADLGWDILNFQSPFPFSLFSPAVDSHEFPVCEPLVGEIQQSAIGNAALESEGPVWGATQLKEEC